MCEIPFFISFFERSGSSYLTGLLDSHPAICCFPEIFHEFNDEGRWTRRPQFASREAVRAKLDNIYANESTASGFKYKYAIQYDLYPDVYEYLLERSATIRMIFLYRRNLLKAAISKQNQLRLRKMGKGSNMNQEEYVDVGKVALDIGQATHYMHERRIHDDRFLKELEHFRHTHVVTYEDLLDDTTSAARDLFTFLGVDGDHAPSAGTRKITNDDIREALSNFGEVSKELAGTDYERYLYD